MIYFRDFLGTTCNTNAPREYKLKGSSENDYLLDELSEFLCPNASQLLGDKENSVMIITTASESSVGPIIESAVYWASQYTNLIAKGTHFASCRKVYGPAPVFAYGSLEQLMSMATEYPEEWLSLMCINTCENNSQWTHFKTHSELP